MRTVLLSVGSRGDVEPYCALSKRLLHDGIHVDLFLQRNLGYLADPFLGNPSFRRFTFPFSSDDFYKVTDASLQNRPDRSHPDPRMKFVEHIADIICELILPCLPKVLEAVDDPTQCQQCIIITSAFTRSLAFLIGHQRSNIPVILLHLQPLLPNRLFPSYRTSRALFVEICRRVSTRSTDAASAVSSHDIAVEYEESYWKIEHVLEAFFLKERVEKISSQCFGNKSTPPNWDQLKAMLTGKDEKVWIVNAYSNHLVPSLQGIPGLGSNIREVGPLADDYVSPGSDILDPSLQEFLQRCVSADGQKPICIGFGSMPFRCIGAILQAIKTLKVRAVLVGDVFQQIPSIHPAIRYKWIFCVSAAPYTWLLPQCSMMLCHGGIGVVQACMRAGIPCLISPLMGDQFAIAQLVEARGFGAQCGSKLTELTSEDIIHAVRTCRKCSDSCQALGREIQKEKPSGTQKLVHLIVQVMNNSLTPEDVHQLYL